MAVAMAMGLRCKVHCTIMRGAGTAMFSGDTLGSSCGDSLDSVLLLVSAPAKAKDICTSVPAALMSLPHAAQGGHLKAGRLQEKCLM